MEYNENMVALNRNTIRNDTGSDVLLRTHSHTFGHERVSEKTTIAALPNAPQTYFFVHDGRSSTRALTDLTGTAVQRYDYDAFGNAIGFAPSQALTKYLYCGELFDTMNSFYYLRARYYDPKVGRFNRLDPFFGNLSDPQSLHKYTYCHGDPVNFTDPSGMFLIMAGIGVMGAFAIGEHFYLRKSSKDVATGSMMYKTINTIKLVYNVLIAANLGFAALGAVWPCYDHEYRNQEGLGGLDVTNYLFAIQSNLYQKWRKLTPDRKKLAIDYLFNLKLWDTATFFNGWDIVEFKENKGKFAGSKDDGFCPDTVTVSGNVYYAEEVNYILWGMINRLAYDDNIRVSDTCRISTLGIVTSYRTVFYPSRWARGSNTARMAWSCAGWDAGGAGTIIFPDYCRLPKATPNNQPYLGILRYYIGDQGEYGIGGAMDNGGSKTI